MAAYYNSSTDAAAARDEVGAALLRSGARTATRADNGTANLYPDVHAAAPTTKNGGAPYVSSGVLARNENGTAYLVDSGGPRTAAQDEDATAYYLDYGDMHAAAKNGRGAAAEKGNVHFFELPYPTQTTAGAYYDSGEALALTLAPQVIGQKTTSVPAAAIVQDKVAGAFAERLRRGLPVLGISVASLAVAGLAGGGEPTPAAGFELFLMLIVGLSAVFIHASRA